MTYPQNRKNEVGIEFTKAGYKRVIKDLEEITGNKFDDESLAKSNEIYNVHNAVMRELSELLGDYPIITATQRNDIFKTAYFMTKEEHTILVKEFINLLKKLPKEKNNKIKVITSGILLDNPNLLSGLDENNIQTVGDDIAQESRQYRVDIKPAVTSLDALAIKFSEMDNCSVLYDADKKRADYIVDMAKQKKASGVLIFITKFCDPEEFDYVIIKKACEAANIPCLQIEVDRQMVNYEQAKTLIQTFKENI
jgi:benzoyl-CoA reductase/2-hydroxyglutaryl-CoA dehydratase subunit BcrC/BadD/HgdB